MELSLLQQKNKSRRRQKSYNRKIEKQNLITEKLKLENPKTPKFHTSPKIHKQGNPGRPVFNSIISRTSNLSRFLDRYL